MWLESFFPAPSLYPVIWVSLCHEQTSLFSIHSHILPRVFPYHLRYARGDKPYAQCCREVQTKVLGEVREGEVIMSFNRGDDSPELDDIWDVSKVEVTVISIRTSALSSLPKADITSGPWHHFSLDLDVASFLFYFILFYLFIYLFFNY